MEYCLGSASDLLEGKNKCAIPSFLFSLDQNVISSYIKVQFVQAKWMMT